MSAEQTKSIPLREITAGAVTAAGMFGMFMAGREISRRLRGRPTDSTESIPKPSHHRPKSAEFGPPEADERLIEANNVTPPPLESGWQGGIPSGARVEGEDGPPSDPSRANGEAAERPERKPSRLERVAANSWLRTAILAAVVGGAAGGAVGWLTTEATDEDGHRITINIGDEAKDGDISDLLIGGVQIERDEGLSDENSKALERLDKWLDEQEEKEKTYDANPTITPTPEVTPSDNLSPPAGIETPDQTPANSSSELTTNQAKEVIDLKDGKKDGQLTIKISKAQGTGQEDNIDWRLNDTLDDRLFNPENPSEHGAKRWRLTTAAIADQGRTPDDYRLVYDGDEVSFEVGPRLTQEFIEADLDLTRTTGVTKDDKASESMQTPTRTATKTPAPTSTTTPTSTELPTSTATSTSRPKPTLTPTRTSIITPTVSPAFTPDNQVTPPADLTSNNFWDGHSEMASTTATIEATAISSSTPEQKSPIMVSRALPPANIDRSVLEKKNQVVPLGAIAVVVAGFGGSALTLSSAFAMRTEIERRKRKQKKIRGFIDDDEEEDLILNPIRHSPENEDQDSKSS